MDILLKRIAKKPTYTIGKLYIDGKYFCDTIEDKDRGLTSSMSVEEIKKKKVYGETAIPTGTYTIVLNVQSAKFAKSEWYIKNCHGARVPRLINVKGYDGILIHAGNTAKDSYGCLLLGENKVVGQVINSKETCKKFYDKVFSATGLIKITIE